MRGLILISLIAMFTGGVARAETWHKPGDPPAGYDGWLILYVLPPPGALRWGSPAEMLASATTNLTRGAANVKAGKAVYGHPIGHVHLEMQCKSGDKNAEIPLTGQTDQGDDFSVAVDGVGMLLRDYPGRLDDMKGKGGQGGSAAAAKDLDARKKNAGFLGIMRFPLTWAECTHLRGYFDSYVKEKAYQHFGSQFRARGFVGNTGKHEGSGCAGFAVSFVDVGGLVPRPLMTKIWARQQLIGLSWIANFLGARKYPYGSNLIATIEGIRFTWEVKKPVPAVAGPIFPLEGQPWFTLFELINGSYVPLTLYDPELMYNDLAAQWMAAKAKKNADWKDAVDGEALVIERLRPACPPAANLKPYPDKVHDLMKD